MNMLRKFFVVCFYICLINNTAYAASTSSADLSMLLSSLHTMRADFVQTVYDNYGKAIQKSYGQLALQRPGKFRWQVTKPIPQVIIANATRLWIYDPDLEQVTIRPLHQAAGESPALLLSHENTQIEKDYDVRQVKKDIPGSDWFVLTPRGHDNMLAKIELGFINKQLEQMRLEDHLGHTTKIEFQHVKTNVTLASSMFTFKKPANVDVIDETRRH